MSLKSFRKILLVSAAILILFAAENSAQGYRDGKKNILEINQFKFPVMNDGNFIDTEFEFGYNYPKKGGIQWPGGRNAYQTLNYRDQFIIGGVKDTTFRFCAQFTNWWSFLAGGKIFDDGTRDDPYKERNRVYRIRKNWESTPFGTERDQFEKDYNEWPAEDGAPWEDMDGDNIFTRGVDQPKYIGDEVIFYVAHDRLGFNSQWTEPINLEFQYTIFGFNSSGIKGDVVFVKIRIINKENFNLKDAYFSCNPIYWPYYPNYTYSGCDTALDLGYRYFRDNYDPTEYGEAPPVLGYILLQGPIVKSISDSAYFKNEWRKGFSNLKMTSFLGIFTRYIMNEHPDPYYPNPPGGEDYLNIPIKKQFQNIFEGKYSSGRPIVDPQTLQITKFMLPGDPVSKTGWYAGEGWPQNDTIPSNIYSYFGHYLNSGPFTIAPYDTQEVAFAIIACRGKDNIDGITEIKHRARMIKKAYDLDFFLTPLPESPKLTAYPYEDNIILWWDKNSEQYEEGDPFIYDQNLNDTTYTFEGYRVWQYKDSLERDPKLLAIYDDINDVSVIEDYIIANGISVKAPVIIGNNKGLRRYIIIDRDAYTGSPLYNGNPYYFGVTAYGYSKESSPTFLESEPKILEVIPGRSKIDYTSKYNNWDEEYGQQTSGYSNADVKLKILDPPSITGDEYEVSFFGEYDSLLYTLVNKTKGDTLDVALADFSTDSSYRKVFDGCMLMIEDRGRKRIDSLYFTYSPWGVENILEVKGPGGIELSNPVNVFEENNSTGMWKVSIPGDIQNLDPYNYMGTSDYELRFTAAGSEYYVYSGNIFNESEKGQNKIPFELWDVKNNRRINIKIRDTNGDKQWSRNETTKKWEIIYGYDILYAEPIKALSDTSNEENYPIGNFILTGEQPETGTVIRINTFKPLIEGDKYIIVPKRAEFNNKISAKENIEKITAFPNPYFGGNELERGGERIIRFTGLPVETRIRLYTLAGVFVREIYKNDMNQYADWDLRTEEGEYSASGIYIAHIDMPGIGTKIIKLAVISAKEYLDKGQ